ncbi:MAG TPA: hypothetical protein VES19_03175 [Candidatus Limnocylindrales bacterium]|nr:hypothetical protein [Candidatus Limnocylindrales bacterium]
MPTTRASNRPALRVVAGPETADGPAADVGSAYVCTWCALRFVSRAALDEHHATSVACRANQRVSSPLQTRYGDADVVWTQPGETTLNRVRARTCRHTHPRARLVNAAGDTLGYQCGWCYGLLPDDLSRD